MSVPASLPELIRRLLARLIPGTRAVPCPVPVPRSSQNTRRTLRSLLLLLHVLTLGSVAPLPAQDNLFTEKIAPLLQQHCISCHGPDAQESGLRLDSLQALNTGGKAGAPIIPGKPDESLLMVAVRRTDSALQMPPEGKLPAEAVAALEQWISQGAHHPDGPVVPAQPTLPFQPEQARQFWAFRPLQPPQTSAQPDSHPIDVLTARLLQQQGFVRNAPADRITLIRRASFMLTGLPPSPEEIDAFLADNSPTAFARVVDRLLDSQQYGEHWGRHWLDVVRYADSNGLDENIAHGNAWRYRNYVIQSFQHDRPFDQFLREQLAGDLITTGASDEQARNDRLIATGFLSLGPKVLAEGDEKKLMLDIIDEQLDTIGRSMLGLTIGCARCHDHKFDPLTQADYYSLAGMFQSTKTMESLKRIAKWHENSIATVADQQRLEQHNAQIAAKKAEIDALLQQATAAAAAGQPLPEDQLPQQTQQQLATLRTTLKELEATVPELPTAMGVTESEVTNARIMPRGNHLAPGRIVPRTIPVVLNADNSFQIPDGRSGRLEFAEWMTGPTNPLTPRVLVNRVWRWHFGRGLVATADNFGHQAQPPINPELLDWLAADFVRSGWSLKALHRRILLSQTWQASADRSNPAEQADPDNHFQWRWTVQRLEAESVRDSILAVCGKLDRSMGQSMLHVKNREFLFDHTSKDLTSYDSFRRSVYLPVIRNNLYDAMSLFDCTDGTVPNGDRGASTVASQALFLMNSPLVISAAEHLAQDLCSSSSDFTARAVRMSRTVLGRTLQQDELTALQQAAARLAAQLQSDATPQAQRDVAVWTSLCQSLLMSNEFLYVR